MKITWLMGIVLDELTVTVVWADTVVELLLASAV
jgi:hypothetical protein